MTKIVGLDGVPVVLPVVEGGPVNDEAVRMVEQLLAEVKSGKIVAVGIVSVTPDRKVSAYASRGGEGVYHCMHSGAHRLAVRLATTSWDE